MYCPQTLNSNVSVYKYSSSKSSPTWRAQCASGLLWNLALYLVLKFTLSLQSSILMSSEFYAYLAVVQPLFTYPSFYLFNPSGLWSPGTPWTLSEWTAWGIVAYQGIILFSDSFRCAYQIYAASGRARSTEEETPRKDVMWSCLTFILLRVIKKTPPFLVVDDKRVACHKSFLTSRF